VFNQKFAIVCVIYIYIALNVSHCNDNCDIIWKEIKPTHCKAWVQKSRRQVAVAETPTISGFLAWTLRQITLMEPRILRWLLDFWKLVNSGCRILP